jgi:hypothetical protein
MRADDCRDVSTSPDARGNRRTRRLPSATRRVFTPKSFGWGYYFNLAEILRRLRLR